MDYDSLIKILLSDNVYIELKQAEEKVFELIPELKKCKGFEQNNKWHIYDVYEHILHVVSACDSDICLRIAALFHDIGKSLTYTEDTNGIGHFYNHWNKSIEIFNKYSDKFKLTNGEIDLIVNLIFYHDINVDKLNDEEKYAMIQAIGIKNIGYLFDLKRADLLSQSPDYHYLLHDISNQEQSVLNIQKVKNQKHN